MVLGLRPEKIRCTAPGQGRCNGEVVRRFFLGSQWMYEVETPLGLLSVLSANDGAEALEQGAAVGLAWSLGTLWAVATYWLGGLVARLAGEGPVTALPRDAAAAPQDAL